MKRDEEPQQPKVQQVQPLPGLSVPTPVLPYAPYGAVNPYGYDPYYRDGVYYDPCSGAYRRRYGYSYQSETDGLWFCVGITAFVFLFWTLMIALAQAEESNTQKLL